MDDSSSAVIEHCDDQLKGIAEAVSDLAKDVREIKQLVPDMAEVKSDVKAIKAAVTDQSLQLNDHERRITSLEQAAERT